MVIITSYWNISKVKATKDKRMLKGILQDLHLLAKLQPHESCLDNDNRCCRQVHTPALP